MNNNQQNYYNNQPNNQQNFNPNFNGQKPNGQDFVKKVKEFLLNTPTCKEEIDPRDVSDNRLICICSYLGILLLIPFLVRKNSRYARFHCNQGLILLIVSVILGIVSGIINGIIGSIFTHKVSVLGLATYTTTSGFGLFLQGLVNLVICVPMLALVILGIYNTVKGRVNELPIIGKFRLIKTVKVDTFAGNGYNPNGMGNGYNPNGTGNGFNQNMNSNYNPTNQMDNSYNNTVNQNNVNNYTSSTLNTDNQQNNGVHLNK